MSDVWHNREWYQSIGVSSYNTTGVISYMDRCQTKYEWSHWHTTWVMSHTLVEWCPWQFVWSDKSIESHISHIRDFICWFGLMTHTSVVMSTYVNGHTLGVMSYIKMWIMLQKIVNGVTHINGVFSQTNVSWITHIPLVWCQTHIEWCQTHNVSEGTHQPGDVK